MIQKEEMENPKMIFQAIEPLMCRQVAAAAAAGAAVRGVGGGNQKQKRNLSVAAFSSSLELGNVPPNIIGL